MQERLAPSPSGSGKITVTRNGKSWKRNGGAQRVFVNFAGGTAVMLLILFPFLAWVSLARVFGMWMSKVPVWPTEIENACEFESDDPCIVVGDSAGDRISI